MDKFKFISQIPATEANATSIQSLTLQDVIAGSFKNPTQLANPDDPDMVKVQLDKLSRFPDRYSGYQQDDGNIVAYMKSGEWRTGDEAPFVQNSLARIAMQAVGRLRGGSLYPKAYGVFGLVADRTLEHDRDAVLYDLLNRSILRGLARTAGVVNVVIHDHDPLLPIAYDLNFKPVGQPAEAVGAPGLLQRRYQRNISE